MLEPVAQQHPARQARQRVVQSRVAQSRLGFFERGDVCERAHDGVGRGLVGAPQGPRVYQNPGERAVGFMDAHDLIALNVAGTERDHRGMDLARVGRAVFMDSPPARVERAEPYHLVTGKPQDAFRRFVTRRNGAPAFLLHNTFV